jgi:LPXTG-motif cell wall-anchored protein
MKLRRALAAAAATAALAPIALLSAPAAFATDETPTPTPTVSEESTTAPEETPSEEASTPASEEPTPTDDATTPGDETTSPAPTDEETAPEEDPSPEETATESTSPSPEESTPEDEGDDENVDECPVDEDGEPVIDISDVLHTSLSGLPEQVVAGSGWTNFKFNVSNSSDRTIENIAPVVGVAAMDWGLENDYNDLVTVQVKRGGAWVDIATEFGEGGAFTAFDLGGGQSVSYNLRVSISRDVPSAVGIAIGLAEYSDEDACWISEDENFGIYYFEVLPAGSDAGDPNDAEPQTGGKDEISDVSEVDVTGELAHTGSDSDLPVIATVGGVAILAGTGVVFAMRRRRAGAEA